MRNFTLVTVLLLCSLCRISDSVSEFHTVEVQPGGEVTMLCSNFTSSPTQIFWFRAVKLSRPSCISQIYKAPSAESYCDGFKNGRFEVTSSVSTILLKIKQVNVSDSGLYFCGYYISKFPVVADATYLQVQGEIIEVSGGLAKTMIGILAGLTVFLTVVTIGLVVKIKKLKKAEQNAPQAEVMIQDSDLNYAAVTFRPETKRNLRPAPETEMERNAIYSATR